MSAAPAEPTPVPTPPIGTPEPPVGTPEPQKADPPKPTGPKAGDKPEAKPWDTPETAQAEIERLRKENAKDRTTAKTQAADEARTEMAQTIGKALGLVKDEPIDPAKLTESLTTAQADAKQAQVALAVYQNATTSGGDPVALLDSTTFLKSVAAIDPTDSAAIAAAIKSAVEANPRLGAAPGTRVPAPLPGQGGSGGGAPDLESQIAAARKAGDITQAIALENQKLAPQTGV